MGKGSRAERELVNKLWDNDFAVMRSPASGGGRKHPQPDILASNQKRIYGMECKSTGKDKVYVGKDEVFKLKLFLRKFGFDSQPLIALRFDRTDWIFVIPEQMEKTKKSYKISRGRAKKIGGSIEDISS